MQCPHCRAEAPPGAQYCRECGKTLSGQEASGANWSWKPSQPPPEQTARPSWTTEEAVPAGTTFCQRCDKPIPAGQSYCPECAAVVRRSAVRPGYASGGPSHVVHRDAPDAGFWLRVGATLIDSLIIGIPMAIIWFVFFIDFGAMMADLEAGRNPEIPLGTKILGHVISWLVIAGFESSTIQGTPGKAILGLKVTDTEGRRIGFLRATLRYISEYPSQFFTLLYLLVAFTPRKQGLHDFIAGTLVVKYR